MKIMCQMMHANWSFFVTGSDNLVGTERSHRNKINKLLTYEAENCRPFYMQTLPASEGTSWNKNETVNEQQKLVIHEIILFFLVKIKREQSYFSENGTQMQKLPVLLPTSPDLVWLKLSGRPAEAAKGDYILKAFPEASSAE
uniref:Uncharacterized protein n=1 Tax=Anguilla anguilla TaxID=7936 RepID=A0A0E9X1Z2_ANGAN